MARHLGADPAAVGVLAAAAAQCSTACFPLSATGRAHANFATPDYLQLEPVGQCNLRCQMCPIQFRQDGPPHGPPAFMEFEPFTRLLDEFPGLEELQLQGLGEPMMHPRFFDMVALRRRAAASRSAPTRT